MPLFALDHTLVFPPVHLAEPDGLLAMGGDLSPERLLLAYREGIFPWYEGDTILWWCPDPRFVLFPNEFKTSKTIRTLRSRSSYRFSTNQAFPEVIHACRHIKRPGQTGTWITPAVEKAYIRLHEMGIAHSAEVWNQDGHLAGGLYGLRIGNVFFGESMFSRESNASRYCFTQYVDLLKEEEIQLIDCQVYSDYLESMGARMIPRTLFQELIHTWAGSQ